MIWWLCDDDGDDGKSYSSIGQCVCVYTLPFCCATPSPFMLYIHKIMVATVVEFHFYSFLASNWQCPVPAVSSTFSIYAKQNSKQDSLEFSTHSLCIHSLICIPICLQSIRLDLRLSFSATTHCCPNVQDLLGFMQISMECNTQHSTAQRHFCR